MKKIVAICIMTCLVTLGLAAESEPHAEADTKVNENEPTTNYGAEESLTIWGGQSMPPTPQEQGLVYFDDMLFDELRAAGMVIDLAILRLYVTNLVQTGDVKTYRVADAWFEGSVTWDSRPDSNLDLVSASMLPSGADEWFETDVTDMARSWLDQTFTNYGFYVTVPEQGNAVGCQFASINHPDSSIHPRLFIEYHAGVGVEEIEPSASLQVSSLSAGNVTIDFWLAKPGPVTLRICDVSGAVVESLINEELNQGRYSTFWAGSSGVYIVQLASSNKTITRKVIVVN